MIWQGQLADGGPIQLGHDNALFLNWEHRHFRDKFLVFGSDGEAYNCLK